MKEKKKGGSGMFLPARMDICEDMPGARLLCHKGELELRLKA